MNDENSRHIKIGRTFNVEERLAIAQCFNPNPLEIIKIIKGDCYIETALHRRFKTYKSIGGGTEWFSYHPELLKLAGI